MGLVTNHRFLPKSIEKSTESFKSKLQTRLLWLFLEPLPVLRRAPCKLEGRWDVPLRLDVILSPLLRTCWARGSLRNQATHCWSQFPRTRHSLGGRARQVPLCASVPSSVNRGNCDITCRAGEKDKVICKHASTENAQ